MHTVDVLEIALRFCERLGYRIRQEYLGEVAGGCCLVRGQKWLFLDLSQNAHEQLALVLDVLRKDPSLPQFAPPRCLRGLLNQRTATA